MGVRKDIIEAKVFDGRNSKFGKSPSWKYIIRRVIKDIIKWYNGGKHEKR
jgi:hypothetical protein